ALPIRMLVFVSILHALALTAFSADVDAKKPDAAKAAPFADETLRSELAAAGLPAPPAIDPAVVAMFPGIVGRVAVHPACFDDPQQIDPQVGSCTYFDSQGAIERGIAAWAIQPTNVTVTCPFVSYQDMNQIAPVL
ncbi:MAG: hypothetical protein ABUS79_30620, partial [Pseudomonadota bacterium]